MPGGANELQIDRNNLDREWLMQATLYQRWAEEHAVAQSRRDSLKDELGLVLAEVELEVRQHPAEFGIDKVTEAVVKAVVSKDSRVIEANKQYLIARERVAVLGTMVEALNHKKAALENLVRLWLNGYWVSSDQPRSESSREDYFQNIHERSLAMNQRLRRRQKEEGGRNE